MPRSPHLEGSPKAIVSKDERRALLLLLNNPDVQFAELFLGDFAGRAHHQVLRLLVEREGDDFADVVLAGQNNIREVIAFPLNQQAQDLMMGAPSEVTEKQLRELNIRIVEKK